MGMSKNIRPVTILNQNIFSFGHSINIGSKKMYYNFSTCEEIKFKNGIMLTSLQNTILGKITAMYMIVQFMSS